MALNGHHMMEQLDHAQLIGMEQLEIALTPVVGVVKELDLIELFVSYLI